MSAVEEHIPAHSNGFKVVSSAGAELCPSGPSGISSGPSADGAGCWVPASLLPHFIFIPRHEDAFPAEKA